MQKYAFPFKNKGKQVLHDYAVRNKNAKKAFFKRVFAF